jgi:hypothetical protein
MKCQQSRHIMILQNWKFLQILKGSDDDAFRIPDDGQRLKTQ